MTPKHNPEHIGWLSTAAGLEFANGRPTSRGPLYRPLEKKGWLTSRLVRLPPEKGGRMVRVYGVTPLGLEILAQYNRLPGKVTL